MLIQYIIIAMVTLSQPEGSCFDLASKTYSIPVDLLKAIAIVESNNNPLAVNVSNKNGTKDIGLMQINSRWLKELEKYSISEKDLYDPCQNVIVSAWILRQKLDRYGYNWHGIGAYHSVTPKLNSRYAWKIYNAMEGLR